MPRQLHQRGAGFTIVELLIVIVIISILAVLVIVAYRGIQQRANTAKTASAIQAYKKALLQYATEKGSYPVSGVCLGEGNPDGKCYQGQYTESATFNNALRPYLRSLPLPGVVSTNKVNGSWGALFYGNINQTIDGQPHTYFLWYVVEGAGTKCPVGPVVGGNFPTYTSNPPSEVSVATTNGSLCWTPMPDPTTL